MKEYFLEIIDIRYILLYLLIINIIGFCAMGIDKFKAKRNYWRIPEGTLIMIAILGGGIGSILGMYTFRHKTKKMKFTVRYAYNSNL
jgi:uncharacterized membrane protein YsdA (DUF1294 family)